VHKRSEAGLVLNDHERDLHLTAEGRKPDDELNRVNVASDGDELGLLLLDEGGDVLEPKLDLELGSLGGGGLVGLGGSGLLSLLLASSSGEGAVGVEELEDGSGLVLGEGVGELVDNGGDLEALVKDGALPLEADVARPLDKPSKVASLRTDVSTDSGGARPGREDRVLGLLLGRGSDLLGGLGLLRGHFVPVRKRGVGLVEIGKEELGR